MIIVRYFRFSSLLVALWLAGASPALADALAANFLNPPPSARPWVYWFPLNGNLSSNGITADLEAMQRAGIGGVLYMETDQGTPPGPARFAGPLWRDLVKHICSEAHRLGLEVNMNNDAGWCGSGGPWITPELSMQQVVWTATNLSGPLHFTGILPQPKSKSDFYRDIALFAFPSPIVSYRIPNILDKSAQHSAEIPLQTDFAALLPDAAIPRRRMVDLSSRLGRDGRLAWNVPAGEWTLLRLGHSSTGVVNHPAPLGGRGLESDKLSREATDATFSGLMAKVISDSKSLAGQGKTLVSTHIDSWETGSQNWTPRFRKDFKRLRGYDPLPLLPVMTGRAVDNLEVSERFLWDVRQTVQRSPPGKLRQPLPATGSIVPACASPSKLTSANPADDMAYAGRADEPMGEFWSWPRYGAGQQLHRDGLRGPCLWQAHPRRRILHRQRRRKMAGLSRLHQGTGRLGLLRRGLTASSSTASLSSLGPTQTAPPACPWALGGFITSALKPGGNCPPPGTNISARCQFLLRQGLYVADLCFLEPEQSPQGFHSPVKYGHDRPGYDFDGCTPEVVLSRMSVKNGRLVLPDGMSYRMLVLPKVATMTPRLLGKIKKLVAAGATVVGGPPLKSPSLTDYPRCDDDVKTLARQLWGTGEPAGRTHRISLWQRQNHLGRAIPKPGTRSRRRQAGPHS